MGSRDRIVEAVGGIEAARALIAANNDDLRLPGWRFDLQCHRSNLKDAIDRAADNVAGLVAIPVFLWPVSACMCETLLLKMTAR
ncbi:hypothetical protein MASR1M32_10280 [Rhodobacter sp.]